MAQCIQGMLYECMHVCGNGFKQTFRHELDSTGGSAAASSFHHNEAGDRLPQQLESRTISWFCLSVRAGPLTL